jgi:hypothetical protein
VKSDQNQDDRKLYQVSVRHVGGAAERECVLTMTIVGNDEKAIVEVARRTYADWVAGRIEVTVTSAGFIEVEPREAGGWSATTHDSPGDTVTKVYPAEKK